MSNNICTTCESTNTEPDIKVDGRQRYKCLDCGITLFFDGEEVPPPQIPALGTEAHFDRHRDKILADRLAIGHAKTLVKWGISYQAWLEIKPRWVKEGTVVEDLRSLTKRLSREEAIARIEAGKKPIEAKVVGSPKKAPTVSEVRGKIPSGKEKEYLKAGDKVWIAVGLTVEQIEEQLRELEYLRGYKQAILDMHGHKDA